MNISRLIQLVMLIGSWLTIPFIGWKSVKRFLPSIMFVLFNLMILSYVGTKRKWWFFHTKLNANVNQELPFIIGPFMVGSLWIFKHTYGNFIKYIFYNTVIDLLFAYPLTWLFKKLRIYELKRFNHFQFFIMFYSNAYILYAIQKFMIEKINKS